MRTLLSALAATMLISTSWPAQAAAPADRRQVLVLQSHVENFLSSYDAVRLMLVARGYDVSARDMSGRLNELEAPADDVMTRAMLDGVVRDAGFLNYSDWLKVARSVLVAERYIADPPRASDFDQAIAELKGDPFLSDSQKIRLIDSLHRTQRVTAVLRPLTPNVDVVAPYADRIREVVGFRR